MLLDVIAVAGGAALAAQDRYTLKIPSGLAFSEFKGYETWQNVAVDRSGGGYRARLPQPAAGQTVSLRVSARGDGGSGIDQTIIDAYRAG